MSAEQQWSDDLSASWERHRADVFEAQRNVSEWLIDEVDPRVLRTGGRLADAVWGAPERNPWLTMLALAVVQNGHEPPGDPTGPGGVFSLARPEDDRALVEGAGFARVRVEELPGTFRYDNFDAYWSMQVAVSGALVLLVTSLPPDEVAAIRPTLAEAVAPFRHDGGYEFASHAVGVAAR